MKHALLAVALLAATGTAHAQTGPDRAAAFTGPHIGVAAGLTRNQYRVTLTRNNLSTDYEGDKYGVGAAAFVGYDALVGGGLILGVGAEINVGGGTPDVATPVGNARFKPRWGYMVTGRVGGMASENLMLYARVGYGEQRYRNDVALSVFQSRLSIDGVAFGLGAETRAGGLPLRFEVNAVRGTRAQAMIGIPIRF